LIVSVARHVVTGRTRHLDYRPPKAEMSFFRETATNRCRLERADAAERDGAGRSLILDGGATRSAEKRNGHAGAWPFEFSDDADDQAGPVC
jgi:protein involved in temperature-dependent protein secretion